MFNCKTKRKQRVFNCLTKVPCQHDGYDRQTKIWSLVSYLSKTSQNWSNVSDQGDLRVSSIVYTDLDSVGYRFFGTPPIAFVFLVMFN